MANILAPGIERSLGNISRTIFFWCLLSSQPVKVVNINAEFTAPGFPENPGATMENIVDISPFSEYCSRVFSTCFTIESV